MNSNFVEHDFIGSLGLSSTKIVEPVFNLMVNLLIVYVGGLNLKFTPYGTRLI